jgi:hypothetical protein
VDPAGVRQVGRGGEDAERRQRDRRRQREAEPRDDASERPCPSRPARDPELAARRARQRLAQRDEVTERRLVEPAAPLDVLASEVADVRDRAAERRQSKAKGNAQYLER